MWKWEAGGNGCRAVQPSGDDSREEENASQRLRSWGLLESDQGARRGVHFRQEALWWETLGAQRVVWADRRLVLEQQHSLGVTERTRYT